MSVLKLKDFCAGRQQREDHDVVIGGEPATISLTLSRTHYGAYRIIVMAYFTHRAGTIRITDNVEKTIADGRARFARYSALCASGGLFHLFAKAVQ